MKNKGSLIALFVTVAVILLMIATRPDDRQHRDAVTDAVINNLENVFGVDLDHPLLRKGITSLMDDNSSVSFIANDLLGLGTDLKVANYGVVSIGRLHGKKMVSLGIFGHVFTFSDNVLNDYIESKIDDLPKPIRKLIKKIKNDEDED